MPDEQIIYLDPNDELTKVRERIEEIPARHIILVVPQQTQLRSHVGWRLLHARAREMSKDVLVISTDRQIRAVAKAAGFKVADSQESPVSSKTRPGSRPSRGGMGGRATQRPRTQSGRGPVDNRPPRRREEPPPRAKAAQDQPAPNTWRDAESRGSRVDEAMTGHGLGAGPSPFTIEEDDEFDQPYEFRVDPSQSATSRPMTSRHEDEEPDPFIEDYRTSRRIREAAQSALAGERPPDERGEREPASAIPGPRNTVPPPVSLNPDPFAEMEDISSVPLPEQRGSTFPQDVDEVMEGIPDISDMPTDIHEVEYLGDQGDFVGTQNIPSRQWPDAIINEPEEDVPHVYGTRPRSSRSGTFARKPTPDFGEEDWLPPIEDQPTLTPTARPRPSGALRTGNRGAQPAAQVPQAPQAPQGQQSPQRPVRNVSTRPGPMPSKTATRGGTPVSPPVSRSAASPAGRTAGRRGGRIATVVLVSLLLLLLLGIGLLYFNTSATVTITVPAKPLSSTIKLNATSNPLDRAHSNVMSQVISFTASVQGQGMATGSVKVGNAKAVGNVTFTNNGQQPLLIPTGTIVSTSASAGGILFVTTAQPVIPVTDANHTPVPVPVVAQNPGGAGNVGKNAITFIPPASIAMIAAANSVSSSSVMLSITNTDLLMGGGATPVPAATNGDIQALRESLHRKLQDQVKAWLKAQLHQGDIGGTPIPDVLGNAQALPQEQLTQAPGAGQPLTSTTFTGQLSAPITVLVVRYAALLSAVQNQLNVAAHASPTASMLTTQLPVQLGKMMITPSKNGVSISIVLPATGWVVQQINTADISSQLVGKTKDQARNDINGGVVGIRPVESTNIDVSPSFLGLMPFRTEQIHIIIQPDKGPSKGTPNG